MDRHQIGEKVLGVPKTNVLKNLKHVRPMTSKKTEKKFYFRGKKIALTYSALGTEVPNLQVWKSAIQEHEKANNLVLRDWIFAREEHKDESWHVHIYLEYEERIQTRSARFYDILGHHPNIRVAKKSIGWMNYIRKDKDYIESDGIPPVPPQWRNYCKNKKDKAEWDLDQEKKDRKEIKYPIWVLGHPIPEPSPKERKRHFLILGKPDCGKSYELETALAGLKVYKASGKKEWRFTDYDNEDLIIYDDVLDISIDEILNVTGTYYTMTPIYGDRKFGKGYWKTGHTRTIIIVLNYMPEWMRDDRFISRFNVTAPINK